MTLPVSVALPVATFDGAHVRRLHFSHRLGEVWAAQIELAATDVDLDLDVIVGDEARIHLEGEPFLPTIVGIVRDARQTAAESTGESTYVLDVAPGCSLLELRRAQRIFQHASVIQIVATLLGEHELPPPRLAVHEAHDAHEYVVQWKETDLAFARRLLAEEGITLSLDPRGDGITLLDDSSGSTELVAPPLPVLPDALAMRAPDEPPCVRRVGVGRSLQAARLAVRDFDFEHPEFVPQAVAVQGPHGPELRLEVYEAQVGDFRDERGAELAGKRRLQALRARSRTVVLATNVCAFAGLRIPVQGAARAGVDGEQLVIAATTTWTIHERTTRLECVPAAVPFRPARLPKPRVHGTQTAYVVTAPGEEIDVDEHGRVEVEFRWDRRDTHAAGASRRVRVAQPWAGAGYGMTLIPRKDDEVIVAYLDGDPDEPIVVGRVHDGSHVDPLALPAQKTQSTWKSRSVPGGPESYNMVRMEDAAGTEMLELRAQRDFRSETLRNAETIVGVDEKKKVGGSSQTEVAGPYSLTAASTAISTGPYQVQASTVSISSTGNMKLTAGGARRDTSANHNIETGGLWVNAGEIVQIVAPTVKIMAGEILLDGGGSTVVINGGGVFIDGKVVDVHGAPIKLNC